MAPRVGDLVKQRYRLLRLIGDGGMGSVFEARHELLGTSVALKFLHPHLMRRPGLKERFLQEAQLTARIKSPHVVRATDVDVSESGIAFFVMEYVPGGTLESLFRQVEREGRWLSRDEAFDYVLQILEGVEAAHDLGIVHRDLKPDNVMVASDDTGQVLLKILDFGVAKLKADDDAHRALTAPGSVMGTPEYMAPEQAYSPMSVDRRADIFAVGVMLYELLSSRRPVEGGTLMAIADAYAKGRVTPLAQVAQVDEQLAAAVHRALAPRPEQRFESAAAFRDAIVPCRTPTLRAPPVPKAFAITVDDDRARPQTAVLPHQRVGAGTMMDEPPSWPKTASTLRTTEPASTLKSEPVVVRTMRSEPPMPASVPPPPVPPSVQTPASVPPPHAYATVDDVHSGWHPQKRRTNVVLVLVIAVVLAAVLAGVAYVLSAGLFRKQKRRGPRATLESSLGPGRLMQAHRLDRVAALPWNGSSTNAVLRASSGKERSRWTREEAKARSSNPWTRLVYSTLGKNTHDVLWTLRHRPYPVKEIRAAMAHAPARDRPLIAMVLALHDQPASVVARATDNPGLCLRALRYLGQEHHFAAERLAATAVVAERLGVPPKRGELPRQVAHACNLFGDPAVIDRALRKLPPAARDRLARIVDDLLLRSEDDGDAFRTAVCALQTVGDATTISRLQASSSKHRDILDGLIKQIRARSRARA